MLKKLRLPSYLPLFVALVCLARAQAAADVIPAERRTTWNPGLNAVGGIPYRTTIYKTLSPSGGDDTAAIQAALDGCPANQVVKLGPGDFRISGSGLEMRRSNITLRGSGTSTRLVKVDRATSAFPIIVLGTRWSADKMTNSVNLSANGIKGSRTVTLASSPSPALYVGQLVYLDQHENLSKTYWGEKSPPGDASRTWFHRRDRPISQVVEIESINGTSITFTTPLHIAFPTADASQLSQYLYSGSAIPETKMSGIEDMTFTLGGDGNIVLEHAAYCWVKNVESNHTLGSSIGMGGCLRSVVRDSYIHTSDNPTPGGAGYLLAVDYGSADNLIENNINWRGNKVMVMRASGGGNVIGYNYMEDGYIDYAKNFVESGINASHMTTPHMELFEGNEAFNFDGDSTWGNSIYITGLRNHLTAIRRSLGGLGLTDIGNRKAIGSSPRHWWYNYLGNVLGLSGQTLLPGQTAFVYEWTGVDDSTVPMWKLGDAGSAGQDATVVATALRHGNFDYVSNTVVWDPVTADHNLPASLYLTAKPAFFGNNPWPWVDPTGTTKLHTLPARARFDAGQPIPPPSTSYALSVVKAGAGSGTVTSSPAGISCGADCNEVYATGTVVTLTATPATGSTFSGWSGPCSGTGSCQVPMTGAQSVTATFNANPVSFTLTVAKAAAGAGTVTSAPAGISCGADCSESYLSGTVVTLTAAPASGSTFSGWSGACSGAGTCHVTMGGAAAVTATFAPVTPNYALTVVKAGTGSGTVTASPAGISCGATCSAPYASGVLVTLTAAPATGSTFAGWSGGVCAGTGSCPVTMSAARSVTATFTLGGTSKTLTVARSGDGSGTVTSVPVGINCGTDCGETYPSSTVVTLTPTPSSGSVFTGWSGGCTGTGACQITMSDTRSVTASFALAMYSLTVTKTGSGSGTVSSSPSGITCGADCSEPYNRGTVVTLSATANSGSSFGGWSGACTGTGACLVTMDGTKSVGASFLTGGAARPVGDFDRDGKVDLLWRHETKGSLYVWFLVGGTMTSGADIQAGSAARNSMVAGLGDLNRDTHTDLLWQDARTGALSTWLMSGTKAVSTVAIPPIALPQPTNPSALLQRWVTWQARGLADFNRDGRDDVIWHHPLTGDLYVWFMNGTTPVSGSALSPSRVADIRWQLRGLADLNGDGQADLVWHHQTTGDIYVWFMNGTTATGATHTNPSRLADTRYELARVADFNNDGKPDLLWRHRTTGDLYVWYMNGLNAVGAGYLTPSRPSSPDWQVAPK